MPIETIVIDGPYWNPNTEKQGNKDKSPEDVCEEISAYHEEVAKRGGKIIGSVVLRHRRFEDSVSIDADQIYITADIPGPKQ